MEQKLLAAKFVYYALENIQEIPDSDREAQYEMWCVANLLPTSFASLFTTGEASDEAISGPYAEIPLLVRKQARATDPATVIVVAEAMLEEVRALSDEMKELLKKYNSLMPTLTTKGPLGAVTKPRISLMAWQSQQLRSLKRWNADYVVDVVERGRAAGRSDEQLMEIIMPLLASVIMPPGSFAFVMDLYALLRMLRTYPKDRASSSSTSSYFARRPKTVETAIVYAGENHIRLYESVFSRLGFEVTSRVDFSYVGKEFDRCIHLPSTIARLLVPDFQLENLTVRVRGGISR
jgi:hypothetical protein